MATKTSLLPEREYIALLGLALPLVETKKAQSLTPANFDPVACALQIIESFAAQRMDSSIEIPEVPSVVPPIGPEPEYLIAPEPEWPTEPGIIPGPDPEPIPDEEPAVTPLESDK